MWRGGDLSPEDRRMRRRLIVVAYAKGERVKDIAALHGVTGRTVSRIAEECDIRRPKGRASYWPDCPPHQRKYFAKMLRHGVPPAEARAQIERENGL